MTLRAITFLTVLFTAGSLCAQTQEGGLKWKFEASKERTEITRTITKTAMNMQGQNLDSLQDQTVWTVHKVVSVENGVAKIEKTIKRVLTTMDNPQLGKFTVDTAKADEAPQNMGAMQVMQSTLMLVDAKISFSMSEDGSVKDVKLDETLSSMPNGSSLEQMARQSVIKFPKDMAVGKSFDQVFEMPQNGMTIKVTTSYTYKGKKGDLADFDCGQKMEIVPGPNMPVEIEMTKHTSDGHYHFDAAQGWPASVRIHLSTQMTMTGPQGQIVQDMNVTSQSKIVDGVDTETTVEVAPTPAKKAEEPKGDADGDF